MVLHLKMLTNQLKIFVKTEKFNLSLSLSLSLSLIEMYGFIYLMSPVCDLTWNKVLYCSVLFINVGCS